MPKLEKLSLARTGLTNKGHLLVKTLTALELEAVDCHGAAGAPGFSQFSRSISLLSRLKSLRLVGCLSGEFPGLSPQHVPIRLPALETLDVVDAPELCLAFIQRLQLPFIISLSLDFVACVGRQGFPLSLEIRRHVLGRGGNADEPAAMRTVAFDSIDGRPSLAYWSAYSTEMELLPDSKPAIQIVFHNKDITGAAIEMAAQLALPGVKCLLYRPRENEYGSNPSYTRVTQIFSRIEKLVVGQAAYHAAMLVFMLNSDPKPKTCGSLIFSSLATLVLVDIRHHGEVDFYNAWAQSFVGSLQTRHDIGKSIRTLAIQGCSVFRRRDIEAIRPYVHELLWDEQAMD